MKHYVISRTFAHSTAPTPGDLLRDEDLASATTAIDVELAVDTDFDELTETEWSALMGLGRPEVRSYR